MRKAGMRRVKIKNAMLFRCGVREAVAFSTETKWGGSPLGEFNVQDDEQRNINSHVTPSHTKKADSHTLAGPGVLSSERAAITGFDK